MTFLSLDSFAQDTINIFQDMDINYECENKEKELAIYFYHKQREHLINFIELKNTHDSMVILKTMLEGCALLTYLFQSEENIDKWEATEDLENLRVLEIKQKNKDFDEDFIKQIRNDAHKWEQFIKPKSKNKTEDLISYDDFKKPIPSMKTLVKNVKKQFYFYEDFYVVYEECCKWSHWNPAGFAYFIERENNFIKINNYTHLQDTFYEMAILCLLLTSTQLNDKLRLENDKNLEKYSNDFKEYYSNRNNK